MSDTTGPFGNGLPASAPAAPEPSPWVLRWSALIAADADVLDVACGSGRHSRLLAARGHRVVAVDRDAGALSTLAGIPGIAAERRDLEAQPWPYPVARFGAIVVVNYLHRPLYPWLVESLRDDGVLIYETFAAGNERLGRPSSPAFLLAEGELLAAFGGRLKVVGFEQGEVRAPKPAVVQRLCAVGPARAWPWVLSP